mmetsp:Transcript_71824/g.163017  ORF Transcript_71824/g.163017 Transcript_71824/m.163017 type:complete len:210 (+) Transcript_71824:140-769(+)
MNRQRPPRIHQAARSLLLSLQSKVRRWLPRTPQAAGALPVSLRRKNWHWPLRKHQVARALLRSRALVRSRALLRSQRRWARLGLLSDLPFGGPGPELVGGAQSHGSIHQRQQRASERRSCIMRTLPWILALARGCSTRGDRSSSISQFRPTSETGCGTRSATTGQSRKPSSGSFEAASLGSSVSRNSGWSPPSTTRAGVRARSRPMPSA